MTGRKAKGGHSPVLLATEMLFREKGGEKREAGAAAGVVRAAKRTGWGRTRNTVSTAITIKNALARKREKEKKTGCSYILQVGKGQDRTLPPALAAVTQGPRIAVINNILVDRKEPQKELRLSYWWQEQDERGRREGENVELLRPFQGKRVRPDKIQEKERERREDNGDKEKR